MAIKVRFLTFLLLACAASSSEAFLRRKLSEEAATVPEEAAPIEEEVFDMEEDMNDMPPEEDPETESTEAMNMRAYEEIQHQFELEQASHEYEEAMRRAQQLEDQARYEQEMTSNRMEHLDLSTEDYESAENAKAFSGMVLKEAKAELKDHNEHSDVRRRHLVQEKYASNESFLVPNKLI